MTKYVIATFPYLSPKLTDDHGLICDTSLLVERATERYLDELFISDEEVMFSWSRLCCDVGLFMRDGATADLVPSFFQGRRIRQDPSQEQIVAATLHAQQHILRLCTQIEHANSLMDVIVLDVRSFDETAAGGALPLADICLGYDETKPTSAAKAAAESFNEAGLSVTMNDPIRGCLLSRAYAGHSSTTGIMVALNRRLYTSKNGQLDTWRSELVKVVLDDLYEKLVA